MVDEIARLTGIPASRIYGVVTFYAQFSTVPSGRHKVCVCQGTACHVRGGDEVLRAVRKDLSIAPGETTPDLDFTLDTVACLGACSFAPVMTVDGQYFGKMKGSRVASHPGRVAKRVARRRDGVEVATVASPAPHRRFPPSPSTGGSSSPGRGRRPSCRSAATRAAAPGAAPPSTRRSNARCASAA